MDLDAKLSDLEPIFTLDHLAVELKAGFISGKEVVFAMTANLRLYLNERLFSSECTSFLLA